MAFVYCWALLNQNVLGSSIQKIVLTGDSAGGNLILGVTSWIINQGIRIPDELIAIYPATLARPLPSPARCLSAMDPLLGTGILLGCLACYTGGMSWLDFKK